MATVDHIIPTDTRQRPYLDEQAEELGLFAVLVTPREEEPQINVTMANVLIPFPGASAKDVEQMVATPAEQVLSQIAGTEHVMSVSRPGLAVLTVQVGTGLVADDEIEEEGERFRFGVSIPLAKALAAGDRPVGRSAQPTARQQGEQGGV